jgi:hypothetical protein
VPGAPPLSYASRNALDFHQYSRPLSLSSLRFVGEIAVGWNHSLIYCSQIRRDPSTHVSTTQFASICPDFAVRVDEFVYITENQFSKEEILKGERIVLQTLEFRVSHYCSPYTWVRRISKADDYDLQTRTLSKFLMEVTLLDHRFLPAKPSLVAAVGMYSARKILGGDWVRANHCIIDCADLELYRMTHSFTTPASLSSSSSQDTTT